MDNTKQEIKDFLDELTAEEIEEYIETSELNDRINELYIRIKERKPNKQTDIIFSDISSQFSEVLEKYNYLAWAEIIAFVFRCFYDKHTIEEVVISLADLLDNNTTLNNYVYDLLKDY